MVQFFETTPTPNFGSSVGIGIGQALSMMAQGKFNERQNIAQQQRDQQYQIAQEQRQQRYQQQQQQQQQSQLMQALSQAEKMGNISPEQKQQIGLLRALSSNPEIALHLIKAQQQSQQTEISKRDVQRKEEAQKALQESLGKLFGGPASQQNLPAGVISSSKSPPRPQGSQGQPPMPQQEGSSPERWSDEAIAQITAMNPQVGNSLRQIKDASAKERRFQEGLQETKKARQPETIREKELAASQAKADSEYNKSLESASTQANIRKSTLTRLRDLNRQNVTGSAYEKALEKIGLTALTSAGRREFAAEVKNLLTDVKSILGSQFSQFEFQTILNAYPSADFSKEANDAILDNLDEFQNIRNKEFEVARDLKRENSGKIPQDYQAKVNQQIQEYAASKLPAIKFNTNKILNDQYGIPKGNVLMFDPKGEPLNVPEGDVEKYKSLGATLP